MRKVEQHPVFQVAGSRWRRALALLVTICLTACGPAPEGGELQEASPPRQGAEESLAVTQTTRACDQAPKCVRIGDTGIYAAVISLGKAPEGGAILFEPGGPGIGFGERISSVESYFNGSDATVIVLSESWASEPIPRACLETFLSSQVGDSKAGCDAASFLSVDDRTKLLDQIENYAQTPITGILAVSYGLTSLLPGILEKPDIPVVALSPAPPPSLTLSEVLYDRSNIIDTEKYPAFGSEELLFAALNALGSTQVFAEFEQLISAEPLPESAHATVRKLANRSRYMYGDGQVLPHALGHAQEFCFAYGESQLEQSGVSANNNLEVLLEFYGCDRFPNAGELRKHFAQTADTRSNICFLHNETDRVVPKISRAAWEEVFPNAETVTFAAQAHGDVPENWSEIVKSLSRSRLPAC